MEGLRSADALQIHWEAAHSKDGGEGAKATTSSGARKSTQNKDAVKKAELFVPPPPLAGEDELEHYRLQVKIMADIINVCFRCLYMFSEGEGVDGRKRGGSES